LPLVEAATAVMDKKKDGEMNMPDAKMNDDKSAQMQSEMSAALRHFLDCVKLK
jgi:hypothetical protein